MLAFAPASIAFAPVTVRPSAPAAAAASIKMRTDDTFAPAGMGKEYVSKPRKPLSEYVGASLELDPGSFFAGNAPTAWDPVSFTELYKVSGNNPDAAWLREAELKHGRISMLAFAGILAQNGGLHLPGEQWVHPDWTSAWGEVAASNPLATVQVILGIAFFEGVTCRGISTCGLASRTSASRATWALIRSGSCQRTPWLPIR